MALVVMQHTVMLDMVVCPEAVQQLATVLCVAVQWAAVQHAVAQCAVVLTIVELVSAGLHGKLPMALGLLICAMVKSAAL